MGPRSAADAGEPLDRVIVFQRWHEGVPRKAGEEPVREPELGIYVGRVAAGTPAVIARLTSIQWLDAPPDKPLETVRLVRANADLVPWIARGANRNFLAGSVLAALAAVGLLSPSQRPAVAGSALTGALGWPSNAASTSKACSRFSGSKERLAISGGAKLKNSSTENRGNQQRPIEAEQDPLTTPSITHRDGVFELAEHAFIAFTDEATPEDVFDWAGVRADSTDPPRSRELVAGSLKSDRSAEFIDYARQWAGNIRSSTDFVARFRLDTKPLWETERGFAPGFSDPINKVVLRRIQRRIHALTSQITDIAPLLNEDFLLSSRVNHDDERIEAVDSKLWMAVDNLVLRSAIFIHATLQDAYELPTGFDRHVASRLSLQERLRLLTASGYITHPTGELCMRAAELPTSELLERHCGLPIIFLHLRSEWHDAPLLTLRGAVETALVTLSGGTCMGCCDYLLESLQNHLASVGEEPLERKNLAVLIVATCMKAIATLRDIVCGVAQDAAYSPDYYFEKEKGVSDDASSENGQLDSVPAKEPERGEGSDRS